MTNGVNGFGKMQEIGGKTRTDGSQKDTYIPAMSQKRKDTVTFTSVQKSKPTLLKNIRSLFSSYLPNKSEEDMSNSIYELKKNGKKLSDKELTKFIKKQYGYDKTGKIILSARALNKLKESKFNLFFKYYTTGVKRENMPTLILEKPEKNIMKAVMNSCDGKYTNDFKNNPISFYMFCSFIGSNYNDEKIQQIDPHTMETIIEATFPIENFNKEKLDSVLAYKNHSNDLNGILSNKKNDKSLTDNKVDKACLEENIDHINTLTQVLQNQKIPNQIHVYRGEGTGILSRGIAPISLNGIDGEAKTPGEGINDVNDLLNEAKADETSESYKKASDIIKKLNAACVNNVLTATQERFMSTSIDQGTAVDYVKRSNGMLWDIMLPKDSHAIYVDTLDQQQSYGYEHEIIVQRDSKLVVNKFEIEKQVNFAGKTTGFFVKVKTKIETPEESPEYIIKDTLEYSDSQSRIESLTNQIKQLEEMIKELEEFIKIESSPKNEKSDESEGSKESENQKAKIENRINSFQKIIDDLNAKRLRFHSEELTDRDKKEAVIFNLDNTKINKLKNEYIEKSKQRNVFYNSLVEKFIQGKFDKKQLGYIEETFKMLSLGLLNQDAAIYNKDKKIHRGISVNKYIYNHTYIDSLYKDLINIINKGSQQIITDFLNQHSDLKNSRVYKVMFEEIQKISEKERTDKDKK